MTNYLLSVHMVEGEPEPSEEEIAQAYADVDKLNSELQEQGVWVFAGGLHPPTTATVVRAHEGDVLVTDGPFPEAKEQLGGFWIISAPDLDVALDWARRASVACKAPVEVRPFQDDEEASGSAG
jgi:hypothetical protein